MKLTEPTQINPVTGEIIKLKDTPLWRGQPSKYTDSPLGVAIRDLSELATEKLQDSFYGHVKLELHYGDGVITSYALEVRESKLVKGGRV